MYCLFIGWVIFLLMGMAKMAEGLRLNWGCSSDVEATFPLLPVEIKY